MERLGDMTAVERSYNLRIPLAVDGREMYLHFLSKVDCIRSCTLSHAPLWGHSREEVICYISISREVMDPSRKSKFNGGGYRGPHRGQW